MRPVTIKYRDGKQNVVSIKADSCSGVYPAGSHTFYCEFYLHAKHIAKVAESRLLPGYKKVYQKLFGRPWLLQIKEAQRIVLSEYRDYDQYIGGLPEDTDTVWQVNHDSHTWVIMAGTGTKNVRSILHVMNNDEITRRGDYKTALKKLFPGKKISVMQQTVTSVDIT